MPPLPSLFLHSIPPPSSSSSSSSSTSPTSSTSSTSTYKITPRILWFSISSSRSTRDPQQKCGQNSPIAKRFLCRTSKCQLYAQFWHILHLSGQKEGNGIDRWIDGGSVSDVLTHKMFSFNSWEKENAIGKNKNTLYRHIPKQDQSLYMRQQKCPRQERNDPNSISRCSSIQVQRRSVGKKFMRKVLQHVIWFGS